MFQFYIMAIFLKFVMYNISVADDEFNWKLACIQREEQHAMWTNHDDVMESFCLTMGHFAAVDSVHLVQVLYLHLYEIKQDCMG